MHFPCATVLTLWRGLTNSHTGSNEILHELQSEDSLEICTGQQTKKTVKSCSGLSTKMNIFPKFICFYSPGHERTRRKRSQGGPLPLSSAGLQKQVASWGLAAPRPGGWLSNSGNETGPSGTARDSAPKQRSTVVKKTGRERSEKVKTSVGHPFVQESCRSVYHKGTNYNS